MVVLHGQILNELKTKNMQLENLLSGLNQAATLIHGNNKAKGFWDKERNVGELLMLVTSELGEAMEAHRKEKFTDWDLFEKEREAEESCGRGEERLYFKAQVKDTFEDEIADAVIRLLDLSCGLGIDLERHIIEKVKYNETRPKLHGKSY